MVDFPTILACIAGCFALFSKSTKKLIFFTWLCSLFVGMKHLMWGSDFIGLGVTLESSVFAYVLFSVVQGVAEERKKNQPIKWISAGVLGAILAIGFLFVSNEKGLKAFPAESAEDYSLIGLSQQLLGKHFVASEALLLIGFISIVGLGLNLRKEAKR